MPRVSEFKSVGKVITKLVEVKSRNFLLGTWNDLVRTTPVKTGKARASWMISAGFPKIKEIPDGTYGMPSPPNLDRYTKNWTQWYITNTAPYITRLNRGYSRQAPVGFIELAIQRNIARYG